MEKEFYYSRFSTHFNRLAYLGVWTSERGDWSSIKRRLFFLHQLIWQSFLMTAVILQLIDLYLVIGNIRKVIYNLSTSVIVVGYAMKMILFYERRYYMNGLRMSLWKDSTALDRKEETDLLDDAYNQTKYIETSFYIACFIFLPIMLISSYFSYHWGTRELPFPAYLPMSDPMDNSVFLPPFILEAVCAFQVIFIAMEMELSTFGLTSQIKAYYKILKKRITKLDDIYGENDSEYGKEYAMKKEINRFIMKEKAKKLIKDSVIRHLELIGYTETFEYLYNRPMFIHIFGAFFLAVVNFTEITLFSDGMSMKQCFQTGFVSMIMVDLLFFCHFMSEISLESDDMKDAIYSTSWYKMDADIRQRLCIMMMRTRKPPKFTAGKMFVMNLNTYMNVVRNIYSWLMLMRQMIAK